MPKAPKALSGHPSTYDRRVRNLIFGRLALIFLVFIVGVLWIATYTTDPLRAIPQRVFALFLIAVAFSVLYLVWLRFGPSKIQQIRVQFLVDAFLITWLVVIVLLTLVTLRLPLAFTLILVLVDVASYLLSALAIQRMARLGPGWSAERASTPSDHAKHFWRRRSWRRFLCSNPISPDSPHHV